MRDVSRVTLRTRLLGEWVESPVGVSPTGLQKMAHEEGEMATAQGITISMAITYLIFMIHELMLYYIAIFCAYTVKSNELFTVFYSSQLLHFD